MAQHDYVIDNQSFPATRTDINNVLLAISSTNSGTSAPSTTYANQLWYDTTNNKLYIRNEDNDAWIPLFLLDQSNDKAGTLVTEIDIEDASGTNAAGTALTVKGGAGTGTGAGGAIIFQTADGGSSGSSVNSHATRVTITDDGVVGIGTTSPANSTLDVAGRGRFLQDASATTGAVILRESSGGVGGHIQFVNNANDAQRGYIGSNSDGDLLFGAVGTERLKIAGSNGMFTALSVYNITTSGAANVNVQSSGAILRSTSSEKYKQNIEDMELSYAQAVLNLRPVYYKSKCDLDNSDHSHWGFIAEEVEKVDPRLVHYKTVDVTYEAAEDDMSNTKRVETTLETPEPEGVQYDRLTPAIVKLLQEQQKTIEALETRIKTLEG